MIDPDTGGPHTYHTTNAGPLILVTEEEKLQLKAGGALQRHCAHSAWARSNPPT